jgi:hypothetical protein
MSAVVIVPLWRLVLVFVLSLALVVTLTGQVLIPGGTVPSGGIIMVSSGGCPSGWSELTEARGRYVVGVPASGTLLATVGSAMTDAQNLSVTPTFTGSTLAAHQHAVPVSRNSSRLTASVPYGANGTSHSNGDYANVAASTGTDTGFMLSESVSGGTPAGTNSAVTTGALAPYVQVRLCRRS